MELNLDAHGTVVGVSQRSRSLLCGGRHIRGRGLSKRWPAISRCAGPVLCAQVWNLAEERYDYVLFDNQVRGDALPLRG
jgi:hypothetical protein